MCIRSPDSGKADNEDGPMIDIDTDSGIQNWLAGLGLADFADKRG